MSVSTVLLLLLVGAGILLSAHVYLRVEPRVAGRALLLSLRLGTLVVLALLLLNPVVPGSEPPATGFPGMSWLLVDGNLSLAARDGGVSPEEAVPLWDTALARAAAAFREGASLAILGPPGTGPEGVDTLALRARGPAHPTDDPREGVLRLAEAGADTVRILGSFRWDPATLDRLEEAAPVPLVLERIGGVVRNAGVAAFDLPGSVPLGDPVQARITVFHEGALPGDSAEVEVRAGAEPAHSFRIPLTEGRGTTELDVSLSPPPDTGQVRYAARVVLPGDGFPLDDERARRIRIGDPEQGILLISLRPDWEARTLLPVLEAVSGLDGEGYLRVGDERFLPLAGPDTPLEPATPDRLRDRIPRSLLLVIHGVEGEAPGWLREGAGDHPRVLHLPAGAGGGALAGLVTGPPRGGEWTLAGEQPATPLAPFLQGISLGGLPPLSGVLEMERPALDAPGAPAAALLARGPGNEAPTPVVVLLDAADGRRAVALATGFWRWGARTGEPRRAYRSLWGGVSDWLLARPGAVPGDLVRPAATEQPRGRSLEWTVPPSHEEVRIEIRGEVADRLLVHDGSLVPDDEGRAFTPSLPPGIYRYEARSVRSVTGDSLISRGEVEVEEWVPSLIRPPLDVPERIEPSVRAGAAAGERPGRRLRTWAFPYVLILLFLSAEWVGRRRMGLR